MTGNTKKTAEALARSLEEQGAHVRRTKKGWIALNNGKIVTIHMTPSDNRTIPNMKAQVLRAGLRWPDDLPY